jgi:hypothetical protein
VRAGPEHIPVGEKSLVQRRPDLLQVALADQAGGVEPSIEMLGQRMVLRRRGPPEMVKRKAEPPIDVGLDRVLLAAEGLHIPPGLDGAELGGRSVFVGGANEKHIFADLSSEAGMDIGGKQGAGKIAEMFDAVHVRQRIGNENSGHGGDLSRKGMPNPQKSKSPSRCDGRAWIRLMHGAKMRALSLPVALLAVGPGHSRRQWQVGENHVGIP